MSVVLPVGSATLPAEGEEAPAVAAVPEQLRLSVHVGGYLVDACVTAAAPLSVVMEGLVPFLVETLRERHLSVEFDRHAVYSLAVEGGMPLPRTGSLADAGILDGARLILREVHSAEVFRPIIEDPCDAMAEFNAVKFPEFTPAVASVLGLVATVVGALLVAGLLICSWWAHPGLWWWPATGAVVTVATLAGAVVAQRRGFAPLSYVLGIALLPLAFSVGWSAVPAYESQPGAWTAANVYAGAFVVVLFSAIAHWLTGRGAVVHSAVITAGLSAGAAGAVMAFTGFTGPQVGAVAVVVGAVVIAAAPAMALSWAKVRPPSLPAPGEDIDRNELEEAAMVVEVSDDSAGWRQVALPDKEDTQLESNSRQGKKYLTGFYAAGVAVTVVGAISALQPPGAHYFYGQLALVIITILALGLRGRSTPDRVQSITFYLGATAVLAGMAITLVVGPSSATVALITVASTVAAVLLAVLIALRLPGAKVSHLTSRRIENGEFLLIVSIPILVMWISQLLAFLRNLL